MGKPKKQTIEDVEIVALGHKGMCIGKTKEGEAVLVKGAVPGDIIDLAVRKRRNKMKWGVPLVIKKRSPHRVEPTCEHFEHCGGCSWQDLSYEEQARQKEEGVYQTIRRIGHVEVGEYKPIIGAQETLYYRNKMVYSFSKKRWMTPEEIRSDEIITEPGLGFYAGGSFDKVINIQTCHLQKEPTNRIRNHVREWALREGWTFYDARAHEGDLRNLMIRSSRNGDIMVTLVTGSENSEIIEGFVKEMTTHFPEVKTVAHILNQKWNDSLQDLDFSIRYGKGYIVETLNNVDFRIGPKSFFQTNPYQAEYLFDAVKQAAGFKGTENLYDLYCGVGTIGLYMSEYVKRLVGVEEIPEAIDDAKINAQINNIENANFEVGDVKVLLDQGFMEKYGSPDVIITDPPRAGMHENVVKVLVEKPAAKMIYVSCNPATQARDLQRLSEAYSVESIQPVDMFPQTNHVESIALLKSR